MRELDTLWFVNMNLELHEVVVSPLETSDAMRVERINSELSNETTWYDLIKRDHHHIYDYLLFLGAFFPKHKGYRYCLTVILALTYVVALSNFIYIGAKILMGNVAEVYPGLVRISSKSTNSIRSVSSALFFCCLICGMQIATCIYGIIIIQTLIKYPLI